MNGRTRTLVPRVAVLAMALMVAAPAAAVSKAPAYAGDFPDPFVLVTGSTYWAYSTGSGGRNLQVMSSPDLKTWTAPGDPLPVLPGWASPYWTWAPAVLPLRGAFLMYYTVRDTASGRQCVSVASAATPAGPFTDASSGPLVCQLTNGGSIDPNPFVTATGTYLLWKSDDNALRKPSSLWGQQLTPDGLDLVGDPVQLLRHDRAWEEPLIEAPALVRDGDTYYLFYSANWWETERYCIGYATGASPLGPYRKVTRHGPWMASGPHALGPGGQEFFPDAGGRLRMAFHAWGPDAVGYRNGGRRALCMAGVSFAGGEPVVQP